MNLAKNIASWQASGVALRPGAEAEAVRTAYRSIGWEPTPDVVSMHVQIGGMDAFDDEGWRLWSPGEVMSENAQSKSPIGVYFSDFLLNSWHYMLVPQSGFCAVYRDNFDGKAPYEVAQSLEEFFEKYLVDAASVLNSDLQRTRRDA